jgi:hypothetical protein
VGITIRIIIGRITTEKMYKNKNGNNNKNSNRIHNNNKCNDTNNNIK